MATSQPALSHKQVLLMAVAAGVSVANIYYNQPILKDIADNLHTDEAKAGSIATLTQVGYGFGLFFLVPLGDKINKKNLILALLGCLAIALVSLSVANAIEQVWAMSIFIGMLSVSAQILLPMAADLSPEGRGKNLGIVFSGLLVGILAARVFSGAISEWFDWRYVYRISAGMVVMIAILLKAYLPDVKNQFDGHYLDLLKSSLYQAKRFAVLRQTAIVGALLFGAFCSFWTTLTFHLSGAPFNYSADVIGLFGLLAIAGALSAPFIGKYTDKSNSDRSILLAVSMILASLVLIKLIPHSVAALIVAVLLIDIGIQIMQVTNLAKIYSLDEKSHSRINTIYMTIYFIGGALGTSAGLLCWRLGGWEMVTWQLLIWTVAALGVILASVSKKGPIQS